MYEILVVIQEITIKSSLKVLVHVYKPSDLIEYSVQQKYIHY